MSSTLLEQIESLIKQRDVAVEALKSINKDLSNDEHIDSNWIKDTIELHSGLSIVERANFKIAEKRLVAENATMKEALEFYADESNYEPKDYKGMHNLPTISGEYPPLTDNGKKAREVLKKLGEE